MISFRRIFIQKYACRKFYMNLDQNNPITNTVKTIQILFIFLAMHAGLTGCALTTVKPNIVDSQDQTDIARCAGGTNVDVKKFTTTQYEAYTKCIVELHTRRKL